ncbi:unnamed protein product [Cuscuta epithymum]|uniref:Glycine-rich protein n=1 Tax=Cuscuta epithymum TaxID=186058 RepID=A0AAV0FP88_9ASTE|nr:unnamed protein product [Cuscuta epithymum]
MQGGRDPFFGFGNPFGGSLGGFGPDRSLMSSFFGGRDPFDDPFFTQPFGGMFGSGIFGPGEQQFMGPNQARFHEAMFFPPSRSQFMGSHPVELIEHCPIPPTISRGPIIEELNSDDEHEEKKGTTGKGNPRKHGRLSEEAFVQDPEERSSKQIHYANDFRPMQHFQPHPQAQSFSFKSSTVSYGGANGAYYTSSRIRRTGSDGLTYEECKEADSTSGRANHKISRGIHDKGHSVVRKLNSDGRVDTMQALHNINEDELPSFEEAWKGKVKRHLPGWMGEGLDAENAIGVGSSGGVNMEGGRGGWALPSTERTMHDHQSKSKSKYGGGNRTAAAGQYVHQQPTGAIVKEHKSLGGRHINGGGINN